MKRQTRNLTLAALLLVAASLACNAPDDSSGSGAPPTAYVPPTSTSDSTGTSDQPAATPEPTSAPAPTAAPAPTSAPPPAPTADTQPALGLPLTFESWVDWRRGDQANGTFTQSAEQAYGGQYSGKLQYDFPTGGNDFVVFVQAVPLPGTPSQITAWVYGDGSGHFVNVWVRDAEGEVWQATFGRADHTGWSQMTAEIETGQEWPWGHISGPDNGTVDYPIEFYALAMDDGEDNFTGNGVLFFDQVDAQ